MIKPLSPQEVSESNNIPDFVIIAFNELIQKNFSEKSARVTQQEAVEEIINRSPMPLTSQEIFKNHWLDVETLYRKEGWKVIFDKPAYNESYGAYFIFSK